MKKLTYSSMAAARLRTNKREYVSLVLGIFLAIFLVTTFFLAAQGFILAQAEQTNKTVGRLDAFLIDEPDISDEALLGFDMITEVGHVYVTASVEENGSYLGYYDDAAAEHMYRTILDGRMPESSGEIAIEQSTLIAMDLDRNWQIGDTIVLSLIPIDGQSEERTFTLVGILKDQAAKLDAFKTKQTSEEYVKQFPALLSSSEEEPFDSGRIAVHRTFLIKGGKLADPYIDKFYDTVTKRGATSIAGWGHFHAISATGSLNDSDEFWFGITDDEGVLLTLIMGVLLGIALMISCGIGIASATEGMLAKRSEETGLLRAVGATKQQIRRMFGRESIILAITVAPLSIITSVCAVGVFSLIAPEQMILRLNLLLLIPISVMSIILIALSGYLPLRRCSKQMPMSVIRDTELLRKTKGIKSKKQFRVPSLISRRLLRLYPTRQIGSILLVALMLFCVVCSIFCVNVGSPFIVKDTPAFVITTQNTGQDGFVSILPNHPLSSQSLAQIRKLPNVSRIEIERYIDVSILLDEKCYYLASDNNAFYTEEEYIEKCFATQGNTLYNVEFSNNDQFAPYFSDSYNSLVKEYNEVREFLSVEQEMVRSQIRTIVLDEETLVQYAGWIESGEIDLEAINAGREVLVAAPNVWNGVTKQGHSYTTQGPEPPDKNAIMVAENDCFYVGQSLPIIQLYTDTWDFENEGILKKAERLDTTVTVGAILNQNDGMWFTRSTILTTEEGLKNMGLYANGMDFYRIYLNSDVDLETEEMLSNNIKAIGSRIGDISMSNNILEHRDSMNIRNQMVIIFAGIAILFTAVSISMIVSSITRRMHSDGRRIGMLRAVGADTKTILKCYTGSLSFSILGGFALTTIVLLFILNSGIIEGFELFIGIGFIAMAILAALSWIICWFILKLRIRNIVNKSIIDNIREL